MHKNRAESRAKALNALTSHPDISYAASSMSPTKWEKDRYGVIQRFKNEDVGIALT